MRIENKTTALKFVRLSDVACMFCRPGGAGKRAVPLFVRDLMALTHRERREVADLVKKEG